MEKAAPEVERYITRVELADLLGVSPRTVDRMREAGMPSDVWGKRSRRFLPSKALTWWRARDHEERGS